MSETDRKILKFCLVTGFLALLWLFALCGICEVCTFILYNLFYPAAVKHIAAGTDYIEI